MRILFCGDAPMVDTGFGVVSRNLLSRLHANGHEIAVLGINYFGDPYDHTKYPYKIYPVDKGSIDNLYAYPKLWWIDQEFNPDLIFFLNDPWIIQKYLSFRPKTERAEYQKMIAYYPTDSAPIKKEYVDLLATFDAQVAYSHYAERVIISSNDNVRPDNLYQVYHGVDTNVFKPMNQSLAREMAGLPQDAFIVGMVARNQPRKRFDILVSAFAKFAKDKPNAKLYLHTAPNDVGFDIGDLAAQAQLEEGQLILTEGVTPARGVPEKALNVIYNTFDVNALLSLGDGFGLPVAESMATGVPQLVSDHSCLQELVEGHGGLTVKTAAWIMNSGGFNTWGGVPDEQDVVTKLNLLYENKELRMQLADQGFNFITQEKFTWDYAANEFENIIRDVFHIIRKDGVIRNDTAA